MYCFEDCENFNINDHVLFETLPDGSEATLKSAIEEHTAIPFDKVHTKNE